MAQVAGWICHARAHVNPCRQTFANRPKCARQPPEHDAEWIRHAPESHVASARGALIRQNGAKISLVSKSGNV
jgi:hypothetical protein